MNLVKMILDQLFGSGLGKLSGLLGESEEKTESAVKAAVPALLSGFSSLASSSEGAQKLTNALGSIDETTLGNLGNMLTGNASAAAEKGGSMLSSLFGGNMLSGIISSLTRFTGLGADKAKSLLGFLSPLILGTLAKQFIGKKINAQSLGNLFADQKANIANAIPSGLSLADVPGLSSVTSAAGAAYTTARDTARVGYETTKQAGASAGKWVLPVLGLAALAGLAYWIWTTTRPGSITSTSLKIPDVAAVTKDVTGAFSSLTDTLANLKDPAAVAAAIPKLTEMSGKLDSMKALVDSLPEAGRKQVAELIKSSTGKLGEQLTRALMIPGAPESLRPALEGIVNKVSSLGGIPAGQFALPSVEVTKLGGELTGMVSSLTDTLGNVKDGVSAEAALPKLTHINGQLDTAKAAWTQLPEAGKATLGSMLKSALANLKPLITKALAYAGASDKVKPMVDQIMTKLADLSM